MGGTIARDTLLNQILDIPRGTAEDQRVIEGLPNARERNVLFANLTEAYSCQLKDLT